MTGLDTFQFIGRAEEIYAVDNDARCLANLVAKVPIEHSQSITPLQCDAVGFLGGQAF